MHSEAMDFIGEWTVDLDGPVLDVGGRDVNGSPRMLWPVDVDYTVLDAMVGRDVNIVADAATWQPDRLYPVVICAEVLEHSARWPEVVATCMAATAPGGRLVITCAGPGRPEHSALDGGPLHPGEHYANVPLAALTGLFGAEWFLNRAEWFLSRGDVYVAATRLPL